MNYAFFRAVDCPPPGDSYGGNDSISLIIAVFLVSMTITVINPDMRMSSFI
jgi:hypothetical protein